MGTKGKYSKTKLVSKRWVTILVLLLILLLISGISFIVYVNVTNNIVYENIKEGSSSVSDDIASKSTPIVVNNIVLGGVYNGTWVSMERYFFRSANKEGYDIDVFTRKGKTGSFKLNKVDKSADAKAAYTTTTRTNYKDEYYAVKAGSTSATKMDAISLKDDSVSIYKKYVEEALGLYGMLNGTVKVREVYEVVLVPGEISYIITATNEGKTGNGVYSAAVYVSSTHEAKLIKYNYVKNVNNSSKFGVYTAKFVADLNGDKVCEILLQETKEFDTKYSVMEYNKGKFYEVISATIKN